MLQVSAVSARRWICDDLCAISNINLAIQTDLLRITSLPSISLIGADGTELVGSLGRRTAVPAMAVATTAEAGRV